MSVFIFRFNTFAVARTWDGGGTDGTCGGVAGDGNKWSCAANWVGDVMPTAADIVTFDATSTKDATIDAGFGGTVTGITVAATYSGTITQARSLTVSGAYSQAAGAFVGSADALTVGETSTFSGGTFDGGTGTHTYTGATTVSGATYSKASGAVTHSASLAVSSGGYTSSATSVAIRSNLVLSGTGAFTASSGTTTLGGAGISLSGLTHSGSATFTHNNGSFIFGNSLNGYNLTYNSATTLSFYDVTFNASGNIWNIAVGDNMSVTHNLTLTDGQLSDTGTVTVGTNQTVSRTVTQAAGFDGGTGVVIVSGTDVIAVTVNGDSDANTGFPGLTLNNPNATLSVTGAAGTTAEFEAAVTVSAGTWTTDANVTSVRYESSYAQSGGTVTANTASVFSGTTFVVSGGAFTSGSGSDSFASAGAFTISGGAFTASSGTTTYGSYGFTHTSGTFAHNNGTVVFGGSSNQTYNSASTLTFYNVEFNDSNSSYSWYLSNDTMSVVHNLTLTNGGVTNGTIDVGTNTGVSRTVTQAAGFDGGVSTVAVVAVSGTDVIAVTVTGDADVNTGFPGLTLNNANATVTVTGAASTTAEFEGAVIVSAGTWTTDANITTLSFETTYAQGGGTFNGGTGTNLFAASLTQSGGTFTAASGTTTFGTAGAFLQTAGTFNHNNGTVEFQSYNTTAVNINGVSAGTVAFYNLTWNPPNAITAYIDSADTLTVANNLVLTNGFIGTGTIEVIGNAITTGSVVQQSGFDGGYNGGNVKISGTYAIPVTLFAGSGAMAPIFLNNTNAIVSFSGTGAFTFTNGNGTTDLTVQAGAFTFPSAVTTVTIGRAVIVSGGTLTFNNSGTTTISGAITLSSGTLDVGTSTAAFGGAYTQSGGTFTKASGTVTHTGAWAMSGASSSYTASSGTTTFASTWAKTAGTFTHNSGTVEFTTNNATAINVNGTGVAGTVTFYNLTWNAPAVAVAYIDSVDTAYVENNLVLTNGLIGTGTIEVIGNVSTTGSVTAASTFDGGYNQGVLKISGTYAIPFTITAGTVLPPLNITNANVTYAFSGSGAISMANGNGSSGLTLAASTMTIPSTITNVSFIALSVTGGTLNLSNSGTVTVSGTTGLSAGAVNFSNGSSTTLTGAVTISGGAMDGGTQTATYSSTFALSGGSWTKASGTMNYTGTFTLSLTGSYTASAGTTNFAGAFTVTGTSTFNHNNGTVRFTAAMTADVNSTLTFYALTLPNAVPITLGASDTWIVLSTLTLTDGTLNTGTVQAQGDVTVASTFDGGSTALQFSGSNTQTFTLASAGLFNGDISVNKTGSNPLNLASALTMDLASQDLTLIEGVFDISGFNLIVNGTSGTFTVQDGATFRLQGGETVTANSGYPTFASGSALSYNGTGASYTLKSYAAPHHLILAGGASTVFSATVATTVGGNLTIVSGILAQAGFNLTVTGTFSNDGTLRLIGSEALLAITNDTNSGTIQIVGDGDGLADTYALPNLSYYSLNLALTDANDTVSTSGVDTLNTTLSRYWKLDDGTGISAADSSGNGKTATLTNMEEGDWTSTPVAPLLSANPYSLTFDGVNEHLLISDIVDPTAYTFSAWVKPNDVTSVGIIVRTDPSGPGTSWSHRLKIDASSKFEHYLYDGTTRTVTGTTTVIAGQWYHVAGVMTNSGSMRLYVNGVEEGTAVTIGTAWTGGDRYYIGSSLGDGTGYFNGVIDDFRIYSTALTPTQIGLLATGYTTNAYTISTLDINGDFTLSNGAFAWPAVVNVAGNITVSGGTFDGSAAALTLDGTSQTVNGTFTVTSLSKTSSGGNTLTLGTGKTVTVTGATTLTGTSAGSRLSLRSSTPTTAASLDMQGTKTLQYLDVQDNTAITTAACFTDCFDSGRNTNWSFTAAILLAHSGGSTDVTEGGVTDTFTVALTGQPASDVTVSLTPPSDVTLDTSSLTFTNANWATPQMVTVTAVNDAVDETSPESVDISLSSSSLDATYNSLSGLLSVSVTDNDTSGFTVTESIGTTAVVEGGATDSYTVVLTSQPTADVTVTVTGDADVSRSPGSLTFTSVNWATPQTVTITAVEDFLVEGVHSGTVTHIVSSLDLLYNVLTISNITVAVTDNDTAGYTIVELGGSSAVTEGGASDTYTVVLTAQPTADVTVTPVGGADLSLAPSSLTFTSVNWATPQTLTISAVNDALVESTETPSITHGITTTDADFAAASIANVVVTVTDNDIAGFVLTESGGTTAVTEGGATDSYTIVLTAQPLADVTVTLTVPVDVTTDIPTLLFTALDWNTPQTVTVTAVDDVLDEPSPESIIITHASTSTDGTFANPAVGGVTVAVTDNDEAPTVAISDATYDETNGSVEITATMTGQSQNTVSVAYASSNGTATAGEDYEAASGTLSWTTTQTGAKTFLVLLDEDVLDEDNETVLLTLSGTVNGTITDADGVLTITDNDATPTVAWTLAAQNVNEDAVTVAVTAQLSAASGRTVTIPFAFGGTAESPADYTSDPISPLTIAPGVLNAILQVSIVDDTTKEQAETISVTIGSLTNATVGINAVQLITVADNETGGGGVSFPAPPTLSAAITLFAPNGGETYHPGDTVAIEWTVPSSRVDFLNYAWSQDDGATWIELDIHVSSAIFYTWTIPDMSTSTGRFRIEATDLAIVYASDVSDAPFTILGKTPVPVPVEVVPIEEPKQDVPIVGEQIKDLPETAISQATGLPEEVTPLVWGTFVRSTSVSTAYYLDPISRSRRPVFNALLLYTYGIKMEDIKFVSDVTLQFVPLGVLLPPKAGTVLVKVPENPRVYFLGAPTVLAKDGLLRPVLSESLAGMFFGGLWNRFVIDLVTEFIDILPHGPPLGIGDMVNLDIMKTREELLRPE